jgi:hypothetical protein
MFVNGSERHKQSQQRTFHRCLLTCKKASSTLGFLRRNLQHCPRGCRRTAYIALIRSIMEYGSVIWDPYTKLESIQRRGARFITKDYKSREEGFFLL